MRLALREMRRRPGRFVVAVGMLTLLGVLLLLLGGLLDGLLTGSTGAVRAQRGELLVFSANSRNSFVRSQVSAGTRATVDGVSGVRSTSGLGGRSGRVSARCRISSIRSAARIAASGRNDRIGDFLALT